MVTASVTRKFGESFEVEIEGERCPSCGSVADLVARVICPQGESAACRELRCKRCSNYVWAADLEAQAELAVFDQLAMEDQEAADLAGEVP